MRMDAVADAFLCRAGLILMFILLVPYAIYLMRQKDEPQEENKETNDEHCPCCCCHCKKKTPEIID
jgi:hypothetical protein